MSYAENNPKKKKDSERAGDIYETVDRSVRNWKIYCKNTPTSRFLQPSTQVLCTTSSLYYQIALHSARRPILRQTTINLTSTNIAIRRPRQTRQGPRSQTLFSAWDIRYIRDINAPKRSSRYVHGSDLAPQITLL